MALSGEQKPLEPNSIRPFLIRPPPERWENVQTNKAKRNKRKKINTQSITEASSAIPPVSNKNTNSAEF